MDSDNENITSEIPYDNTEELRAELLNLAEEGIVNHKPSSIKKAKKDTIKKLYENYVKKTKKLVNT